MPRVTAAVLSRSSCQTTRQRGQRRRAVVGDIGRELAHRLAARALAAVHVERQPDRQRLDLMLPGEFGEHSEIGRKLAAFQGRKRRGQHAKRVRGGDADGLGSDIERHQSASGHERLQFREFDDRHASGRLVVQPGGGGVGDPFPSLAGLAPSGPGRDIRRSRKHARSSGRRGRTTSGGVSRSFSAATNSSGTVTNRGSIVVAFLASSQGSAISNRARPESCTKPACRSLPSCGSVVLKVCDSASRRVARCGLRHRPHFISMRAKAATFDGRIASTLAGGTGVSSTPARARPRAQSSSAISPPIEWPITTGFLRQGAQLRFEIGYVIEQAGDAERTGRGVRWRVVVAQRGRQGLPATRLQPGPPIPPDVRRAPHAVNEDCQLGHRRGYKAGDHRGRHTLQAE